MRLSFSHQVRAFTGQRTRASWSVKRFVKVLRKAWALLIALLIAAGALLAGLVVAVVDGSPVGDDPYDEMGPV